jgi:hypothetical protein
MVVVAQDQILQAVTEAAAVAAAHWHIEMTLQ